MRFFRWDLSSEGRQTTPQTPSLPSGGNLPNGDVMAFFKRLFSNTAKPKGVLGRLMLKGMNKGHEELAKWARPFIDIDSASSLLDIGCGGGRNLSWALTSAPQVVAVGLDYSPVSVAQTVATNKKAVDDGRCKVLQANVLQIPELFEAHEFDIATAFETIYFWPEIDRCFVGICRILKPGGRFFIVNEAAIDTASAHKWAETIDGMNVYEPHQIVEMLEAAGFEKVVCHEDVEKNRLCVEAFAPVG